MIAITRTTPKPKEPLPPLENGDHLDQKTFHERYEAMPPHIRAELIGGIVYMSPPQKSRHGKYHFGLAHWLGEYEATTPGVEGHINTTQILNDDSEPQPDAGLFILPDHGGHVWEDGDEYLRGTPEWIGEISDSTARPRHASWRRAGFAASLDFFLPSSQSSAGRSCTSVRSSW